VSRQDKFRVEFRLGSPLINGGDALHFDALIMALNEGVDHLSIDSDSGIKMASKLFFLRGAQYVDNGHTSKTAWSRRAEKELLISEHIDGVLRPDVISGRANHLVVTGSGGRKNYGGSSSTIHHAMWYHVAVAWGVGDRAKIEAVLKRITGIGRHIRLGFGLVVDVQVFDDDKASEYCLMRNLSYVPIYDDNNNYAKGFVTTKAPYWSVKNKEIASIYIGECPDSDEILQRYC
jgi:CRISPR type IV-associated protein Csf3